jgi:hypothetical protein
VAAVLVLAVAAGAPGGAAAKKPPASSGGLGCLVGKWVSNGIQSPYISGLKGTVLTISRSSVGKYDGAEADYDHSSPMKITGTKAKGTKVEVTGLSFARIFYVGHGRYKFTPGFSSEEITLKLGKSTIGPLPVKRGGGFADLKCSTGRLSSSVTVPTSQGSETATSTFRRAH